MVIHMGTEVSADTIPVTHKNVAMSAVMTMTAIGTAGVAIILRKTITVIVTGNIAATISEVVTKNPHMIEEDLIAVVISTIVETEPGLVPTRNATLNRTDLRVNPNL